MDIKKLKENLEKINEKDILTVNEANLQSKDGVIYDPAFGNVKMEGDMKYYLMINPETGSRYDIPMVKITDPGYAEYYVELMKMKETNPTAFNNIINWN